MGDETVRRISDFRESLSSFSKDFSRCDNSEGEIDDPISAYFKQRCGNYSKNYFKKHIESDSDSSLGCIDVDNVSLFDDGEASETINLRLSENLVGHLRSESLSRKHSDVSKTLVNDSELPIEKQRALAQKALSRLNGRTNEIQIPLTPEMSREGKALSDISSKLINTKFSLGKAVDKVWFQRNCSPDTPRCFSDELSSFGGEDESLPNNKNRQSQYAKNVSSILKELSQININSDMKFESQSKEEQINRFEEDERKFKLENSGVMHNSGISQFSGITGGDISQCPSDTTKLPTKLEPGEKRMSIGQFFNMRSNRVSSLVGSECHDVSLPVGEQKSESSTLSERDMRKLLKNDYSLPVNDTFHPQNLKPRRCLSTYDLKTTPNATKNIRHSTDSSASNSTIMIQNILAEMESGLSGTQIYDKLMKSYGRKKVLEKENQNVPEIIVENRETPKSSKVQKRTDRSKNNRNVGLEKEVQIVYEKKSPVSGVESKENEPVRDCRVAHSTPTWNEKGKRLRGRKGFDASTPKIQVSRSQNDKFKAVCGKVLMTDEDWEVPRVSSIQRTVDLNKSSLSEENDKTIMVNSTITSSELNKKSSTIVINDTLTIEDTIVAGDLTVLSQRIEEMKGDGVCIVRSVESEEPELLTVVQKLADLPKGTIDCSALTPLLRDQFPELLSNFPTPSQDITLYNPTPAFEKPQDTLLSKPGSWIKLPSAVGQHEKIYVCAEVKKSILVPIVNISKNWLLVSVKSLKLIHSSGQNLIGIKKNDEWTIFDVVTVFMKETIIPPESQQSLKILFTPKVPTKLDLQLDFILKGLINQEAQTRSLRIHTNNINPLNNINVIPKDSINFGIIADQCYDQRTVQVSFDGICELPLMVYIEEESQSQHFILKPYMFNTGSNHELEGNYDRFHHVFHEGEKQLLEFRVIFQPHILLDDGNKTQDFKALLILKIGTKTDSDGILQKIPIKGSVGFAKFLCNPTCTPLVFRAAEKGQSVTRAFPLKNVGCLPIAFSVKIISEESKSEADDNVFVAPKSFYLSRNEESAINVTFNANVTENCTKRVMILQMKPNGRAIYDVELIGIVVSASEGRPISRTSGVSASTKSLSSTESIPIKLVTTAQSLSWPAVPLEKEMRQTFQIKNSSCVPATARVTFKKNLDSFKLINENGEKVQKMRKVLKPDCPYTLTVSFRPDLVGAHHNALFIETSQTSSRKQVGLCGIGGLPSLFMGNVKSDLNGCRLLRLQSSPRNSQLFGNNLLFKNEGRIPGFIMIKTNTEALSLNHELSVTPSACVIAPESNLTVNLCQKLKSGDLQSLLSGKDISKIATLSVIMGDEPSRLRMRRLIESGKVVPSERLKSLTAVFADEKEMSLKGFEDSPAFENLFLKSLKTIEVAVVVERISGVCEPTMLEDEETINEFVTICSANDNSIASMMSKKTNAMPSRLDRQRSKNSESDMTLFSVDSLSSHNKITKWLETLDCPSN